MWAKIITIKRTKGLNYFSLCAFNLFNTQVSQFELNYWNKWTFPWHSNLLRCTCTRRKGSYCHENNTRGELKQLQHTERNMKKVDKRVLMCFVELVHKHAKKSHLKEERIKSSDLKRKKKWSNDLYHLGGSKLFLCSCWTKKWNGA